jgi:superfamily II DNA or RNA helicase
MKQVDQGWSPGMQVRLIHDPMRIGMLTDAAPRLRKDRRQFQIRFPDIVQRIYEDQLEPLPEERLNPLDLLEQGKLGTAKDLRRTLTHVRLTGHLADIIYSMEATNTDFYAYQFKPVIKLLETATNGLLIADEVGLGKTIEAGLIWTELRSRFNLKKLVVLCPAALREKWRDELVNKIGVSPVICDAKDALKIIKDPQSKSRGFAIVASHQGLRPARNWEDEEHKINNAGKLARFLNDMEGEEPLIDLLVVDEAHHMRNPEGQTHRLGQLMRGVSEYLVMLTATPIHNYNQDLFALLHLLDPDTFVRQEDLVEILSANAPLVEMRDAVLRGVAGAEEVTEMLRSAKAHNLLNGNRQLERIMAGISEESLHSLSERSRLAYDLDKVNLLGHAITRTRKRDVEGWRVVRDPQPEFVDMTEVEKVFYDLVTDIVTTYAKDRDINETFLLATPQRQMASCMPAALKGWRERRIEIAEDQLSATDEDQKERKRLGPLTQTLVDRSYEFTNFDELAMNDSKYGRLSEMLRDFFELHPGDKVIVFSTFRGTLAYLSERLNEDGMSNIILQGGGRRTKDDIIQEFKNPVGPSILLSSEVGGEGVDLQFCWVVINYDLPWNPMRVEQRIGRVDRLGQKNEKVLIWNLFYADTVDARIYQRLYEKLDLCRTALGDFEAILGDEIKKLTHDLLTGELSPIEEEERIGQTAQALETLKQEEENLEADAAQLVAHGDYILQQVRAAREMNRWINGTDLQAYVTDFLNIHYPGYELVEEDAATQESVFSLTAQAKYDLSEFMKQNDLIGQTQLVASRPVVCKFENRVTGGSGGRKEIISQFHPLVRFISSRISETAGQIRPAVAVKISGGDIDPPFDPGVYLLAVSLWSVRGLRDVENLVYEAVNLDRPEVLLGEEHAERLSSVCAGQGKNWLEARTVCDLTAAHQIANDNLFGRMDGLFNDFIEKEKARNEDRADIQERNLDRYISRQQETIRGVIENNRAKGKTKMIPANEGKLRALEERYKLQKLTIDSRRSVTSQTEDICLSVVLVE